jgi:hypothetical protein
VTPIGVATGAILAIFLMLAACAPTYDDKADQMLVDLQKETDDGLIKLETVAQQATAFKNSGSTDAAAKKALSDAQTKLTYAANIDWYASVLSDLTALEARMTASPDFSTSSLNTTLADLRKNIELFQAQHAKANSVSPDATKLTRQTLDQQFKTLTVYMVTLKSGKKA